MSPESTDSRKSDVESRTWLKPQQIEAMKDACLSSEFPTYLQDRNLAIVSLMYDTGFRASETVGLDTEHVDLDEGVVRLPSELQKSNAPSVRIGLGKYGADSTRDLRRYLRDRWKDVDALFPSRSSTGDSERLTTRSLRRLIGRIAEVGDVEPLTADFERVDCEHVHPHTIRHSVAYRIINQEDGRLEDVQLRLRHANRSTTEEIYSHYVPR